MNRHRLLPLLALVLLLATSTACGGGGDSAGATTAATDPRAGYFGADESAALNPPLAALMAADKTWGAKADACNEQAVRLYDAGVAPRKAIACHLRLAGAMRDASRDVRTAARGLDGAFRPECVAELGRYRATLTRLTASWQRSLDRWNAYGRGDAGAAGRISAASDRAQDLTRAFIDEAAPAKALTVACYTAADRAEADAG